MLDVVTAHSQDIDSKSAFDEILQQCTRQLHDQRPSAGLLFTGIDLDYEAILDGITWAWPGIELIGCTTKQGSAGK